jgi:hypothetical protein
MNVRANFVEPTLVHDSHATIDLSGARDEEFFKISPLA